MSVRFYKPILPGSGMRDDWSEFPAGQTIAETLGSDELRAWVNGREVSAVFVHRALLKDGVEVYIEPIPKDPISLSIAAAIAAGAAAAASTTAVIVGLTVLSIGLSVGGALLAQKKAKDSAFIGGSFNRLNALTGTSNQTASFQAIPRLFGRLRYFPPIPMTAKPYTEIKGSDQYLRMFFCLGYGPLELGGHIVGDGHGKITETTVLGTVLDQPVIRIGATDIAEYEDLQYEIGTPDQMTLYTDQIIENQPDWTTESDSSDYRKHDNPTVTDNLSTVRTTETEATGFSIDVSGQIYTTDSRGRFKKIRIQWQVEWRLSSTNDAWQSDTFTQQSAGSQTSRVNYAQDGLTPGQYDVRLTRLSTYFSNLEGPPQSKVTWSALRTLRDRRAFTVPGTVVMSVKVRATDQINGTIEKLSVLPTAVVDVYENGAWSKQPTRAHAWAFSSVWTDTANREPVEHADLNTASLLAWEAETNASGRYYDAMLDDSDTTINRVNDICAGGRARWTIDPNTSIRVVLDTVQNTPKMLISPYNSSGYAYQMSAYNPPNAVKVRYIDPISWENTDRVVYDDGFDESNATIFETIDASGCSNSDQAWKDGRRYLANRRLRDIEKHTFTQGIQHYKYGIGDLLALANEVILVSLAYGRVDSVTTDSNGQAVAITANTFLPMPKSNRQYGIKIHRMDGTVVVVNVTNDAPGNNRVVLADATADIEPDCHIVFGETGKITIDVKATSITPRGDSAQIVCVPAAMDVLEAETGDIPAPPDDITIPPSPGELPPNAPTISSVVSDVSVATENDDGSLNYRVAVFVVANSGRTPTDHIDVQARLSDDTVYAKHRAVNGAAYFDGFYPGDVLIIRAKSYSADKLQSDWVYVYDYTVTGRIPPKPTGISIDRGTFEATFAATGGTPASIYDYYYSAADIGFDISFDIGFDIGFDNVEANAIHLPTGITATASDLDPDTDYWVYARARNTYATSDFIAATFKTKNEPNKRLKYATDAILAGPAGSNPFATLRAETEAITGNLQQEVNDRVSDVEDEAQARADALLNEKNSRESAITLEQTTRQSADDSLAESISTLSAGTGEQFDSAKIWYFDSGVDGWTGSNGVTETNGYLKAGDGSNPTFVSPAGMAIDGSTYKYVKARIRQSGGPAWNGDLYWKHASDSNWQGPATLDEPTFDADDIATIGFPDIVWTGTIDRIRIDLAASQSGANYYEIDWLAVGRPTPGASVAAVKRESQARIDGDSAQALERETLAAQLRGSYDGTNPASLSQGLLFRERQARVSADGVITTDLSTLKATVTDPSTGLTSRASVTALSQAQTDNESARSSLATTLKSDYNSKLGTKATSASVNSLSQTVSDADQALGNRIDTVTATAGDNATDISNETIARVNKDNAIGLTVDNLSAKVVDSQGNVKLASISTVNQVTATANAAIARHSVEVTGYTSDGKPISGRIIAGANGETADLILDFDRLMVGRVNKAGVAPFVLDSNGDIIIDTALIESLTFGKLTDAGGNFVVDSNGRLKSQYINVDNLQVNYSAVIGAKPPVDAEANGAGSLNIELNIGFDGLENPGEGILYGTTNGIPDKSKEGFIAWGGRKSYIPRSPPSANGLYSFLTGDGPTGTKGFLVFLNDSTRTFTDTIYRVAFVRKNGNQWQSQSDNNSAWYNFTPDDDHLAIGWLIAGDDNLEAGGLFGQPVSLLAASFPGSDVTLENTAKNISGQGALATKSKADYNSDLSGTRPPNNADVTGINTSNDVKVGGSRAVRQAGADKTGSNTSNDVQVGTGKAVRQSGADKTGSNTAYDTSRVAGKSATQVKNEAAEGAIANNRTANWARANNVTLIDGRKIYTGDAYIDNAQIKHAAVGTLTIAGQAVTFPKISSKTRTINLVSRDWTPGFWTGNSGSSPKLVTVGGLYQVNGFDISSSFSARVFRVNGTGISWSARSEVFFDDVVAAAYLDTSGAMFMQFLDINPSSGVCRYVIEVKEGSNTTENTFRNPSISMIELKR